MSEELAYWDDETWSSEESDDLEESESVIQEDTDVLGVEDSVEDEYDLIGSVMEQDTNIVDTEDSHGDTDVVNTNVEDDTAVVTSRLDQTSFTSSGWDCTCYGSCCCKYYRPKSENDDDCFYCGHHKSDHTPR